MKLETDSESQKQELIDPELKPLLTSQWDYRYKAQYSRVNQQ